ncbi:hypothetical protein HBI56_095320 [Parastagonospora nodorum]|uniref:Uncharacterized protein n=1 Tax=Phaeosphaeria nodorum (strain SN15 / ATCC MYA-4574 / FGSC 10173) TaxID=321614 RepID=A0A7U2F4G0_PHANO|nr:hypothetical protein HBH56_090610 [Parastagonospora nodorum]QRC98241.1 hypothetical protein JI435_411790 [Parastagonospora nodorum SN15]KAH3936020.1 hypothetical protein HBH54_025250 [Parastagonospora nodorum]KAH3945567.1 hypothetical protein HBH53_142350 [Parastagonospora nodorum]KAH3966634.1 hypothetical protein HBH51_143000 [Parastagonospora nodorum]
MAWLLYIPHISTPRHSNFLLSSVFDLPFPLFMISLTLLVRAFCFLLCEAFRYRASKSCT